MQKKVKFTVEYDGKTEVYEAFSLMATMIEYPHDAPVQGVTTINTGHLSPGDFISAVAGAIANAKDNTKELPTEIRDTFLSMAIKQGLEGGLFGGGLKS